MSSKAQVKPPSTKKSARKRLKLSKETLKDLKASSTSIRGAVKDSGPNCSEYACSF